MAKCIRVVGQGVPVRVTDEEAVEIVERDRDGEYCTRAFWREWWDRAGLARQESPRQLATKGMSR